MSITAILDVEESYQNAGGMIFAFCIIYSLLIVVALRYALYFTSGCCALCKNVLGN